MADYPQLAATLLALKQTMNDPQGTEAANKLDDSIRQTRLWCYDFLSTIVDETTGKLKNTSFANSSFPSGIIRGSNPTDGSQREILQASVLGKDVAIETIEGTNLKKGTVTKDRMANNSVGTDQLENSSVTQDKLAALSIGGDVIADQGVTSAKIKDGAVISGKIATNSVGTSHLQKEAASGVALPVATEGQILVGGNGLDGRQLLPAVLSGIIQINKDGVTSFSTSALTGAFAYTRVAEKGSSADATGGGTGVAATWNTRGKSGVTKPWSIDIQSRVLVKPDSTTGRVYVSESGVYLVSLSCPAHRADAHKMRVTIKPDINSTETFQYEGTSEYSGSVGNYAQTRSTLQILLTFRPGSDPNLPYFYVEHWIQTVGAADNTLGRNVALVSGTEYFAIIEMFKLA